jgi:hypothetical protein
MEPSGPRHRKQSVAQLERNAALQRVTRTRRFVIGGAAALSAGIAALVSAIAPGHSLGANKAVAGGAESSSSNASTARASVAPKKMPPLAKPSDLGLSGPPSGPTPSAHANQASSGNSGSAPSGNSGNTGNSGSTGSTGPAAAGNSGSTGSTGSAPAGNSGVAQAAPQPAPVTSGGS